ncbi:hypothetical protein [Lacimicrobium alkaliphilum]|uniref:DUF3995 domain-containing protein n=1 Tax=Lacimicrobium alkaliphilum TaxID=1526571 RepID=A0A0U2JIQ8_9ALTE|nr:hypothetical protein [Lacimicrobium alkaliphilum]ALS98086.1 hypothetical protein AT746_07285 [Lacimicrobium alkaliphilum]
MQSDKNTLLIIGAICSFAAALAHLGCIVFGGDWYRFFGAGEQMASMAEQGLWYPTIVTSVLVVVLLVWSLYALSGARVITRLPLLRSGLCAISAIYLIRGVAFIWLMPMFPENSLTFWLVSSGVCLTIGLLYALGTYQVWESRTAAMAGLRNPSPRSLR